MNWKSYKETSSGGDVKKMYRKLPSSFNRLLTMILPWVEVCKKQSSNASKGRRPIVAKIKLHCTLCFLGGGSVHDIQVMVGMSSTSFYRCDHHGIDAINACPGLSIRFPLTCQGLLFYQLSWHNEWMCC